MLLHIGATTPAGVAITIAVIFLLIFAMSFAFGSVPEGRRRFSSEWVKGWLRASIPRLLIAGAFSGLVLAGALAYGGNSTQAAIRCDRSVPPITGTAVTDARILAAIESLGQMTDAANSGDVDRLRTIWLTTDGHNLTHDIDGPLRPLDPTLARTLCTQVVALENEMVGQISTDRVAGQAQIVAGSLQQARPVLQQQEAGSP